VDVYLPNRFASKNEKCSTVALQCQLKMISSFTFLSRRKGKQKKKCATSWGSGFLGVLRNRIRQENVETSDRKNKRFIANLCSPSRRQQGPHAPRPSSGRQRLSSYPRHTSSDLPKTGRYALGSMSCLSSSWHHCTRQTRQYLLPVLSG